MIGTQSAYAGHAGISRQAVSQLVKKGVIILTKDKQVDFAEADTARGVQADPARLMVDDLPEVPEPSEITPQPSSPATSEQSYTAVRTERESYQAKLAKLEYEKQVGLTLPRKEIENAMVLSGRKIRQGLDGVIGWSDELDAASRNGSVEAVRAVLKKRVRDIEALIAASLNLLGNDED